MRTAIFGWKQRDRPPFFGDAETWDYLAKCDMDSTDEEKIRKIMERLYDKYDCEKFKFIFYPSNSPRFSQIWEV